jgi:hypothetical protein
MRPITFDTVRAVGLTLPGVEEGTTYGSPALKVGGKMFACMAVHRSAEPKTLVVRLEFEQRDELLAADPETYYVTDHYVDYPSVLVRLTRVHHDALPDLLRMAYRFVTTKGSLRREGEQRRRETQRRDQ